MSMRTNVPCRRGGVDDARELAPAVRGIDLQAERRELDGDVRVQPSRGDRVERARTRRPSRRSRRAASTSSPRTSRVAMQPSAFEPRGRSRVRVGQTSRPRRTATRSSGTTGRGTRGSVVTTSRLSAFMRALPRRIPRDVVARRPREAPDRRRARRRRGEAAGALAGRRAGGGDVVDEENPAGRLAFHREGAAHVRGPAGGAHAALLLRVADLAKAVRREGKAEPAATSAARTAAGW